ncbi:MAG: hypothetical protein OWQ51_03300 [Pyrobaculum arsenaticum]|uniref:Membrane protein n=1 Tax=Pyrobaculum oguniense (strain DSM 13380 / JCM 10595 / TE7) TaxID=698757 RepID=H6QE21_PYROT|nr:putative membrane protein [Pyrobaculum oguniense TE7]MCY0889999.1 hypothetical protein [Pyrobaculum arsenaticum]
MPKAETLLTSALVAVEGAHAFSAFLPSIFTIRRLAVPQDAVDDLRLGYIPASIFALALGTLASLILRNWWPLAASIMTIIFMISAYEWAIRSAYG